MKIELLWCCYMIVLMYVNWILLFEIWVCIDLYIWNLKKLLKSIVFYIEEGNIINCIIICWFFLRVVIMEKDVILFVRRWGVRGKFSFIEVVLELLMNL